MPGMGSGLCTSCLPTGSSRASGLESYALQSSRAVWGLWNCQLPQGPYCHFPGLNRHTLFSKPLESPPRLSPCPSSTLAPTTVNTQLRSQGGPGTWSCPFSAQTLLTQSPVLLKVRATHLTACQTLHGLPAPLSPAHLLTSLRSLRPHDTEAAAPVPLNIPSLRLGSSGPDVHRAASSSLQVFTPQSPSQ